MPRSGGDLGAPCGRRRRVIRKARSVAGSNSASIRSRRRRENLGLVVAVPVGAEVAGRVFQLVDRLRQVVGRAGIGPKPAGSPRLADPVGGDRPEPLAERPDAPLVAEPLEPPEGREQDVLRQVVGLLRPDAMADQPPPDQGPIEGIEPLPGVGVPLTGSHQEAHARLMHRNPAVG